MRKEHFIKMWVATALFFQFSFSEISEGSAWVKSVGQYYAKINFSSGTIAKFRLPTEINDMDETSSSLSVYGEYGLPTPWQSQLALSAANKTINRVSTAAGDSFKSQSFGDTEWHTKHSIFNAGNFVGSPVSALGAGYLGGTLPTTSKKYRVGEVDLRNPEVTEARRFLISPIDDGIVKYSAGAVVTLSFQSFWASYDRLGVINDNGDIIEERISQEIGSGLPMNSWIQLSVSKSRKFSSTINDVEIAPSEFAKIGLSAGGTFNGGFALELGVLSADNRAHGWDKNIVYSFGISHRTL